MINDFNDLKQMFGETEKEQKSDIRKMNPWQVIKDAAAGMGIRVNEPNPHCKHCYGRGYIGIKHDTGEPIPCKCIWPKSMFENQDNSLQLVRPKNRAERRKKRG